MAVKRKRCHGLSLLSWIEWHSAYHDDIDIRGDKRGYGVDWSSRAWCVLLIRTRYNV